MVKSGQPWLNRSRQGQIGAIGVKQVQLETCRGQKGSKRDSHDQTGSNRVKQGKSVSNREKQDQIETCRGQMGSNRVK